MSRWLEDEKVQQTKFKTSSSDFSEAVQLEVLYKDKLRPFCLPPPYAEENLFAGILPAPKPL